MNAVLWFYLINTNILMYVHHPDSMECELVISSHNRIKSTDLFYLKKTAYSKRERIDRGYIIR